MFRRLSAVLLITLIMLELAARIWEARPVVMAVADESTADTTRFPPGLFRTATSLNPGVELVAPNGIHFRTNSLGYRDEEIDPHKRLWLFLGDSTTFGLNLEHEQAYTEQVERLAGDDVQAVNAAVVSWSTVDEYRALQGLLNAGYRFEWVTVAVFANDPADTVGLLNRERQMTLWDHFALVRIVTRPLRQQAVNAINERWKDDTRQPGLWNSPEGQAVRDYLDRIVTDAQTSGAKVAILYIPLDSQDVFGRSYMDEALQEYAAARGVVSISGPEAYRAYLSEHGLTTIPLDFYSYKTDMGHPSIVTSRLLAQTVYEALAR